MRRLVFNTSRLVLRPLRLKDYRKWFEARTKCLPAQSKWDSGPLAPSRCGEKVFRKIVLRHRELAQNDKYYHYAAFCRETAALVGLVDFTVFVRDDHQFANFGYLVYNRHWGKGYGQEASAMGLSIGFKHLKLHRLEAAMHLDNRKSIRLARSIGMRREGIKRRYWLEDGKWVDHLIYVANPEDRGLSGVCRIT